MNIIPHTRPPCRRGFTLIEVLIVIAIIAVLASIVFMMAQRMRRSAQSTSSVSNIRQIHALMAGYVQENNGIYPISVYQDEVARQLGGARSGKRRMALSRDLRRK